MRRKSDARIDLLTSQKWAKTHAKGHGALGASFCRFVMEGDAEEKRLAGRRELPTCMECRRLVQFFRLMHEVKTGKVSVNDAVAQIELMDKRHYAHIAEIRAARAKERRECPRHAREEV